jgi:hypothetical protein
MPRVLLPFSSTTANILTDSKITERSRATAIARASHTPWPDSPRAFCVSIVALDMA